MQDQDSETLSEVKRWAFTATESRVMKPLLQQLVKVEKEIELFKAMFAERIGEDPDNIELDLQQLGWREKEN